MTHPKALWRRNTKRCPSVTFKIGNILDIFLYVHWHRPHHSAPVIFIIGQKKKFANSPFSSPDSSGRFNGCFSGEGHLQMLWGLLPSSTQQCRSWWKEIFRRDPSPGLLCSHPRAAPAILRTEQQLCLQSAGKDPWQRGKLEQNAPTQQSQSLLRHLCSFHWCGTAFAVELPSHSLCWERCLLCWATARTSLVTAGSKH